MYCMCMYDVYVHPNLIYSFMMFYVACTFICIILYQWRCEPHKICLKTFLISFLFELLTSAMCSLRVRNSLTESSPSPFLSAAASSSSTDSLSQSSGSKAFKTSAKPSEKIEVTAWEINYEFLSPCKVVLGCTPGSPLLSQLISGDGSRSVSIELLKCLEHLLIILPCDLPVVVVFEFQLLAGPFHHHCHSWRLWALGFSRCGRNVLGRGFRCGHGHVMSHQVITMETSSSPNVVLWRRIHKYPSSTTKKCILIYPLILVLLPVLMLFLVVGASDQ